MIRLCAVRRAVARDRVAEMPGDRLHRVLAAFSAGDVWSSAWLCGACPGIAGVSGAGVMLMSGDVPRGSICSSNEVSELIEQLQYTLGEGPCVDACQQDRVVAEPDLANPKTRRWPAFTGPALVAGVRAVFAFPLRVGAVRLGALNLYRDRPAVDGEQHADALVIADVAARSVLEAHAGPFRRGGRALEIGADFHYVVHHAAGMVSIQLSISVTEALVRLRAYAFSHDRRLANVAEDVVTRRLPAPDELRSSPGALARGQAATTMDATARGPIRRRLAVTGRWAPWRVG